jgi:eukaryotic translation initiation factor 2C
MEITYKICLFRSVSYCPPAYYAHLVAFRGRNLFSASSDSSSEMSGGGGGGPSFAMVHRDVQNRM